MTEELDDPEAWFEAQAAAHGRSFWLDGGGAREWSGRRSVLGHLVDDDVSLTFHAAAGEVRRHAGGRTTVVGDDPFVALAAELEVGPSDAQWFGYFGYAARPDLPARPDARMPDAVWMRPSVVRHFTHDPVAHPTTHPDTAGEPMAGAGEVPQWYREAFARVQEELRAGNSYEVNLTHRVVTRSSVAPARAYERLRRLNPAPYAGFLQHDVDGARAWLLSSSPERYAVVTADRLCATKPIKGTTPRGATPQADEASRAALAEGAKFRAENLMIVDLLRNDLAMVCEPGSVQVPALMQVESYASVHQLVSTVQGRLRGDVSTPQVLRALFPAGSMTGAPKLRTMEIVDAVESTPRGAYAGAFGWVAADGRADLGVVIRSLMTAGDGDWVLGTGGGITVHSEVAEEWAEAAWKAERLLRVFDL
ncbi:anthranilate synthase component I family protein [Nocardioides sp. Y6]|uniref:Anthranilate synthase component I family protein n=1 Tax=Nocardioides malaquae TaxID=2773426 RepID=A0ABR9RWS4_9ACTN|nr:anthranilate synthase component I family protein [Nocardioides malaquae]MBE7325983.1 anthranilate synthase component I family protein [Nocardioides malaquae]